MVTTGRSYQRPFFQEDYDIIFKKTFNRKSLAALIEASQDKVRQDNKRRDHDKARGGLWITQNSVKLKHLLRG
jgi:hypothetical protein